MGMMSESHWVHQMVEKDYSMETMSESQKDIQLVL